MEDSKCFVMFCLFCGSSNLEILDWETKKSVRVHCLDCENENVLKGFTIGFANLNSYQIQDAEDTRSYPNKNLNALPPWEKKEKPQVKENKQDTSLLKDLNFLLDSEKCIVHPELTSVLEVSTQGDMNVVNIASCCVDYRNNIVKKMQSIFKKYNIQQQTILHEQKLKDNFN